MKKKLLVVLALIFGVAMFAGCNAEIEYSVHVDRDGTTYYDVYVYTAEGDMAAYFGSGAAYDIQAFMVECADRYGFTLEYDPNGYYHFERVDPPADDEEDDEPPLPSRKGFFTKTYAWESQTVFSGLIPAMQGYSGGDKIDAEGMVEEILFGHFELDGDGMSFKRGLTAAFKDDVNLIEKVKADISKLNLTYVMKNYYTGFFSDCDYKTKSMGLTTSVWDLTGDSERVIQIGQLLPVTWSWYLVLIVATVLGIAIALLLTRPWINKGDQGAVNKDNNLGQSA